MIVDDLAQLATSLDELTLLPGNPRVGDVPAIARSLKEFGQRKPVVARKDGIVLAGNHTVEAARQLGWTHVAVVHVDDDDLRGKAFALADNRTSELGHYDDAALAEMIAAVHDEDLALLAAAGYTPDDLAKLLAQPDFDGLGDEQLGAVSYSIIVECVDERQQARLLAELEEEGFTCRPIAS